ASSSAWVGAQLVSQVLQWNSNSPAASFSSNSSCVKSTPTLCPFGHSTSIAIRSLIPKRTALETRHETVAPKGCGIRHQVSDFDVRLHMAHWRHSNNRGFS